MTLLERIAAVWPKDALYCLSCGRHGCPTAPCPTRRSAVHFGHEPPRMVPRGQLGGRAQEAYPRELEAHDRWVSYPWSGR